MRTVNLPFHRVLQTIMLVSVLTAPRIRVAPFASVFGLVCLFSTAGRAASAIASQEITSEPAFEVTRVDRGWAQNAVTAIVQTRQGYLWLGTYHGLARFDGISFKVFGSADTA